MNQKASVLVIDDDHDIAELMACFLAQEDFRTFIATDGMAGLEQAQTLLPALILCDLTMPGLNGVEVIQKLKGDPATAHIPVVLTSGHAAARFDGCGAKGFLQKPCHMSELVELAKKLISERDDVSDVNCGCDALGCTLSTAA